MVVISSVQFSSVAQLCPTLCDPMNRSTPGLPVYHQLLEFTQTHVHRVSDAIQPSHPLSSPSPPAPSPSQHQSLFQWVNSSQSWNSLNLKSNTERELFEVTIHFFLYTFFNMYIYTSWAPLVAQLVKNLPAMRETWVWFLGWEDTLEKQKSTHSSILAWRIPWTVSSIRSQSVGHDWATFTFTFHTLLRLPRKLVVKNVPANAGDVRNTGLIPRSRSSPGGGNGNPLQYSCLENTVLAMDRGAWKGYTPWGCKESDMTEVTEHTCTHFLGNSARIGAQNWAWWNSGFRNWPLLTPQSVTHGASTRTAVDW